MKMKEDIRPITYLKSRAAELLRQVNETQRPVIITQNGVARAVIQDPESYERMQNTLAMIKIVEQAEEDIRAGRTLPHKQAMEQIRKELEAKRKERAKNQKV
jgi:prevent-host-death family protein